MFRRFSSFIWSKTFTKKFLRSVKVETDISERANHFLKKGRTAEFCYKIIGSYGDQGNNQQTTIEAEKWFYFDAPYRFILLAKRTDAYIPVACISFDRVGFRTIRIKQIQGPSYDCSGNHAETIAALSNIKWERLLVQFVSEWARANGAMIVELISCMRSQWYREPRHQQMFLRYDVTARRMGFKPVEDGIYSLETSQIRS